MKIFTCFISIISTFIIGLNAQSVVYVNVSATGTKDGSSWKDAFTDLQTAIDVAAEGSELWIAKGTYRPSGAVPITNGFTLKSNLSLYGGFAGTETNLNQRDVNKNLTTISGDKNGDDDPADNKKNRTDNAKHTFYAGSAVINTSLDGLTISGGSTAGSTGVNDDRRGGGFLCFGAVAITNCVFKNNYGYYGGGFYPRGGVANFILKDCLLTDNTADFGGGMYIVTPGGLVDNCRFEANQSASYGTGIYIASSGTIIQNSVFESNVMTGTTNAGGAGIYMSGSTSSLVNVKFIGNTITGSSGIRGGALFVNSCNTTISDCEFTDNRATNSGGAVHVNGINETTKFIRCKFDNNSSNFGGAITNYNSSTATASPIKVEYEDCSFFKNTASTSGGAVSNGFKVKASFKNCTFTENTARFGAGVFAQNDETEVSLIESDFITNNASDNGGGFCINAGMKCLVDLCKFEGNSATVGGGMYIVEDSLDLTQLTLTNSSFIYNSGLEQAGAVNLQNADSYVNNCLFANNFALEGTGAGGAFSINVADGDNTTVKFINNTFALNQAVVGSAISPFTDGSAELKIQALNNIFYNPNGNNYEVEGGDPIFQSLGGNLASDKTFNLNGPNDDTEKDPLFVDELNDDFKLKAASPCVNRGISHPDVYKYDIEGRIRDNMPDKGCHEFGALINTKDEKKSILWSVSPDGDNHSLNLLIDHSWTGKIQYQILDLNGNILTSKEIFKSDARQVFSVEWNQQVKGIYLFRLNYGDSDQTRPFMY
ncbi:MAG: hypothetical protein IPI90_15405 [Saprospiraceae bacterium]|nr:hypothetical protein [Candidatus Vicinibacter affinis]